MSRRFVMVSPFFPPLGSSGVQRSAKLARYAAELGWTPEVVCMKQPPNRQVPMDPDLAKQVAHIPTARLPRLPVRLPFRALHTLGLHELAQHAEWWIPMDGYVGWAPFAIAAAREAVQRGAELVYTTSQPFSSHLVGYWLRTRHGVPWVADFRDPWTTNDRYPEFAGETWSSRWKTAVDTEIERRVLATADQIVTVVGIHKQQIVAKFGVPESKVEVIHNGYDEADFDGYPYPMAPHRDIFRVTFFGRFNLDCTPAPFLSMLRAFLPRCENPERVRFRVVGEGSAWLRENADLTRGLEAHLELMDYVPHDQVPALMTQSSVLLVVFTRAWSMTGKLFEYLRSGLPVLGTSPAMDTRMEALLRDAGTGHVVHNTDIEAGADRLHQLYEAWRDDAPMATPRFEHVEPLSRHVQAARFVEIFEQLTQAR